MTSHDKEQHKQADADGRFRRQDSQFRSQISKEGPFHPEKGRYLLYCALICPWACRTLIVRSLKGLEDVIGITQLAIPLWLDVAITGYKLGKNGWDFAPEEDGCDADPVNNFPHTKAIYQSVDPTYNLRYTIPILFDKKTKNIVNNESSEIIRFFNSEFDEFVDEKFRGVHFYPENLRPEIDALNDWV
jgi:glutathionyl-hydroquinone reductase